MLDNRKSRKGLGQHFDPRQSHGKTNKLVEGHCCEGRETIEVRFTSIDGKYFLYVGRVEKAAIKLAGLHHIRVEVSPQGKPIVIHRGVVPIQIQKPVEGGGTMQRLGVSEESLSEMVSEEGIRACWP